MATTPGTAPKKRKVGEGLASAFDAARAELEEREAKVEEREEALRKALEGVDNEKRLMAGCTPNDVLPLNIGGTKCHVLRKTLTQYDKSLLAARFSGRWDDNIEKDADGFFFIDQPTELMMPLIDFLRAKAIETPAFTTDAPVVYPKSDGKPLPAKEKHFYRLVEYYGMTPFVYPQCFGLHRGLSSKDECTSGAEPSIKCTVWNTYLLKPFCHDDARWLKSYEVTLGPIERPQIGWACESDGCSNPTYFYASRIGTDAAEHKGIGDEGSIALDRDRGGIMYNGQLKKSVAGLQGMQEGAVITCESTLTSFRWLINGMEVASIGRNKTELPWPANPYLSPMCYSSRPAISGKGQWTVTQFCYA